MTKCNGTHQGTLTKGTVVLLVLTSVVQMLLLLKQLCTFCNTSYLNEKVNCTEASPSVSIPLHINGLEN
jgi:hypothetical protein